MKPAAARPPHRASCLARPMSAATLAWLVFLAIAMEGAPMIAFGSATAEISWVASVLIGDDIVIPVAEANT